MRKIFLVPVDENLFFAAVYLKIFERQDYFLTIHICIIMASESLNPTSEILYQNPCIYQNPHAFPLLSRATKAKNTFPWKS